MHFSQKTVHPFIAVVCANCRKSVGYHSLGERSPEYDYNNNNNNNNNNIYRGSPTRQGGFQWGPHALI